VTKQRKASPEELVNDPSLKWNPYRPWELLQSDAHCGLVRFLEYTDDGRVRVATVHGITPLPQTAEALQVRRPN
jgi:hypothetical protein